MSGRRLRSDTTDQTPSTRAAKGVPKKKKSSPVAESPIASPSTASPSTTSLVQQIMMDSFPPGKDGGPPPPKKKPADSGAGTGKGGAAGGKGAVATGKTSVSSGKAGGNTAAAARAAADFLETLSLQEGTAPPPIEFENPMGPAALLRKWLNTSHASIAVPLCDIGRGGCRPHSEAGMVDLRASILTNAGTAFVPKGRTMTAEEKKAWLRTGILIDHYILLRRNPKKGAKEPKYLCPDRNHRLRYWPEM